MRYCHNCHKTTTGEPMFCHFCGFTYDAKLCSARHINPRWAIVCSQCGSRDLSTPAPPVPFWLKPLLLVASLLPGLVLAEGLAAPSSEGQWPENKLGLLALLWYLYMHLPALVRWFISKLFLRPKRDDHGD
jgi:hypothetical protein